MKGTSQTPDSRGSTGLGAGCCSGCLSLRPGKEERKEPECVAPSQAPFLRDAGLAYTFKAGGKGSGSQAFFRLVRNSRELITTFKRMLG